MALYPETLAYAYSRIDRDFYFVFLLMYFTPGDPALLMLGEGAPPEQYAALRESMGLDDPVYVQYFRWLGNAVRGDLGRSLRSKS